MDYNLGICIQYYFNAHYFIMKRVLQLNDIFKAFLFICCFIFVAIRGYRSFKKYLEKQEAVDISFQFIGRLTFPSISFCSDVKFTEKIFDDCNLTDSDYVQNGMWVGAGIENCTDAKKMALRLQRVELMALKHIIIKTYQNKEHFITQEKIKSLNWQYSPLTNYRRCFTLTLPEHMVAEGELRNIHYTTSVTSKSVLEKCNFP